MTNEIEVKQQTEKALKAILASLDQQKAQNIPMSDEAAKRLAKLIKKQLKENLH